jgi:transcription initiation factor TFIIH subunit 4
MVNNSTGIMDYLQTCLPRTALLELFQDDSRGRYVCRAVLQRLPETSQQIIIRLSCCGGSFPYSAVQVWTKSNSKHKRQFEELYQWAIIVQVDYNQLKDATIELTPEFFKGLRDSLHRLDAAPWNALTQVQMTFLEQEATKVSAKPVSFPAMTCEDLERYTQTQWDAVLHYLVGTPNLRVQPNAAVTHFLLQTNLMQPDPDDKGSDIDEAPLVITQKGYDFMLQDNAQQVWHFVVQYLQSMEAHEKAAALKREAMLVLICLSFARFGECYSAASLSKDGRVIMKDLALFGLLYVKKIGKTSIFYPTRIAMQLVGSGESSSSSSGGGDGSSGGGSSSGGGMWSWSSKALDQALAHPRPHDSSHLAIICQTNFLLCAYTTSELHVSMLGLFCDVQSIRRLPNCVFMQITRDSIKAAFTLGIQAQQILRFLEKHSHPKLRQGNTNASPLPGNVVDQIYLWDRERHRVTWNEVFTHQCMLPGEFYEVQDYCFRLGALAWSNEGRNQLFVKYEHAERVQTFVRQWRAKTAAGQD